MISSLIKKIADKVWTVFLNGLLTLLPITITFGIFSFSIKLLNGWLAPIRQLKAPYLEKIPHGEILLVIAIIFFAGLVLKSFILQSLFELFEFTVSSIPIVRPVYTGVKQLVHAFSPSDTQTFKQVVLVEFPRKGCYSVGFLTSEIAKELSPTQDEPYYNIFIPTTPNPTTGFFIIFTKKDFMPVDITTEEAMALIISGGIIQPARFK